MAEESNFASNEISEHIKKIQEASKNLIDSMRQITGTISKVNNISTSIAVSVEQQRETSEQMSKNINEMADGVKSISNEMQELKDGAAITESSSHIVLRLSDDLVNMVQSLKDNAEQYLKSVKEVS